MTQERRIGGFERLFRWSDGWDPMRKDSVTLGLQQTPPPRTNAAKRIRHGSGQLTSRQAIFVRHYLVDRNGKQAAIRSGCSPRTAEVQASTLLSYPKVAEAVAELAQEQADKLEITSEAVLLQVYCMAMADVRRLVDETGQPIPLHLLPEDIAAAIQDVVIKNEGGVQTYKVRLCDRNSALDKLMKHLGLYEKDNRQTGNAIGELMAAVHGGGFRLPTTE